jgi:hypothetical protein
MVIWVPLWSDDVSANQSKLWNKHLNIYLANGNLPGALLQQEFFVHFASTSGHASTSEQMSAILERIRCVHALFFWVWISTEHPYFSATHKNPLRCFNGATCRPCRVILRVPCCPCDNPQGSELASHNGKLFYCRKCMAGGPAERKESDAGYDALYKVSDLRMCRCKSDSDSSLASFGQLRRLCKWSKNKSRQRAGQAEHRLWRICRGIRAQGTS